MNNNITILICTSPIPSHPSTAILDETITNIRKYTDAKAIIMADGVHESISHRTEDYEKYLITVKDNIISGLYGDCSLKVFEHHRHQSEMTKQTLKEVTTPLIMFVEHDTSIIGEIPFNDICDIFISNYYTEINYIRFNIFHEILKEHKYLMLEKFEYHRIPLTQTLQYSARPHIARTDWYKDILWTYFSEGERCMIEDKLHSIVISKYKAIGFDTFGLFIYTPNGNQLRSYHSDGRGTDEKIISA